VSALLLSLLILVRQHECLWALLCMAMIARPTDGWTALRLEWRTKLVAALPFAVPILVFLAFWRVNGAVAISSGAASIHPDLKLHAGNVFAGVLMIGLLLPLQVIRNFGDFVRQGLSKWWLLLIPVLAFAAFWFGFRADHPFNGALAYYLEHYLPTRLTAAILIAAAACFFWRVKIRPAGSGPALAAVTAIFLTASWMIEPRYILGPVCLWLAMREHDAVWVEYATFVIWMILSALMIWLLIATGFNV
jgi:alpha-1,2-glucosyltransferase